jgi:succinate dehydrogenase / fumarate reductase cytochrome b subunit
MTTRAMTFYGTTIGKKVVMAISGLIGVGYLVGHMSGNLLIFKGAHDPETRGQAINAYAHFLHTTPSLLWGTRFALIAAIILHVHSAFSLWGLSSEARPRSYYQRKDLATNYAALTMRYGGLTLLAFIIYHLLHLTWGMTGHIGYEYDPENCYNNLVLGFMNPVVSGFYILAMGALGLHLYHGIWSLTQTLGADHPKYNALRTAGAAGLTMLIVLGFIAVPISVLTGTLEPMAGSAVVVEEAAE